MWKLKELNSGDGYTPTPTKYQEKANHHAVFIKWLLEMGKMSDQAFFIPGPSNFYSFPQWLTVVLTHSLYVFWRKK